MRRSLLALLRGPDARSLGRALACLLLLNAVVAGLHSGALAAPGVEAVICAVAMDDGPDAPAAPDHPPPCCPALCASSTANTVTPTAAGILLPPPPDGTPPPGLADHPPAGFVHAAEIARGPPVLA